MLNSPNHFEITCASDPSIVQTRRFSHLVGLVAQPLSIAAAARIRIFCTSQALHHLSKQSVSIQALVPFHPSARVNRSRLDVSDVNFWVVVDGPNPLSEDARRLFEPDPAAMQLGDTTSRAPAKDC